MIPDRRRHRVCGFLAHLTWPLRRQSKTEWTETDQLDHELEAADWKWRTP